MEKVITKSQKETQEFAQNLAKKIAKNGLKKSAMVLALHGDLGAGKTTFTQGFAKGLGVREKMLSPTFVIMKKFKIPTSGFKFLYHIDCYRLHNEKDMLHLDFTQILENPENIVVVEWPEKIQKILPKKNLIAIDFSHLEDSQRKIIIR